MNRRQLIKGIGAAICAGMTPSFLPSLIEPDVSKISFASGAELFFATRQTGKTLLTFDRMLASYLTEDLLCNEFQKRDYLLAAVSR